MTRWMVPLLTLPLLAAGPPPRGLSLTVPQDSSPLLPIAPAPTLLTPRGARSYAPAPLPNRDLYAPQTRADTSVRVSPSLFTRSDQYRGEGYSPGSTAQSEQEKRVKPGAGLSLHMPFTGH